MSKIEIPNEQPVGGFKPMGDAGTLAAASGAKIAEQGFNAADAISSAASSIAKIGQEYFNKAEGAIQDSVYNNVVSKATMEYNKRVQDRINTPFDENGNPTFANLTNDLQTIGKDVFDKYATTIANPDTQNRFAKTFNNLQVNRQLMSLEDSRKQQLQYSVGSLSESLDTLHNAAASDLTNKGYYLGTGGQMIDDAVKHGFISPEEGVLRKKKFNSSVEMSTFSMLNLKDPQAAQKYLENGYEMLGMTPEDYLKASHLNRAAISDQRITENQQQKQQVEQQKKIFEFNAQEIDLGISKGTAKEADIEDAYNKGLIDHKQRVSLIKSYYKQSGQTLQKIETRNNISNDVQDGKILNNYTPEQINDHYADRVKSATDQRQAGQVPYAVGKPLSLQDKAVIASQYKAPVSAFTKEIVDTAKAGTPDQILQAVNAFDYVEQKQPLALKGMDEQSLAFMSSIRTSLKYTHIDPGQAVKLAQDQVFNKDNGIYPIREDLYKKESAFKSDSIESTVKQVYELGWFGGKRLDPEVVGKTSDLLHRAYLQTGSVDSAITMVKTQTKGLIGVSDMNSTNSSSNPNDPLSLPSTFKDSTLMVAPPESVYPMNSQELRADLAHALTSHAGALPAGVQASNVLIHGDEITSRQVNAQQEPTYSLYYKGANGEDVPLLDPTTKQVMRWKPDVQQWRQDQANAATNLRGETIQNRNADYSSGPVSDLAAGLLRKREGLKLTPYWDQNAHRVGYGSDTVTGADGSVIKVTPGTKISKADAERDLTRRVNESETTIKNSVGDQAWNQLPPHAKAALISMTYNYGRVMPSVAKAIRTGDLTRIAEAVKARANDNGGINRSRRLEEAKIISGAG